MKLEKIKISDLKPHPKNYNKHPDHQIKHLAKSHTRFGQFKNIVIDENNVILCGHGFVEGLKELKIDSVEAHRVTNLTESQKLELLAADNLTAGMAEPDMDLLAEIMRDLESPVDVPGVTDALLAELEIGVSLNDEINDAETDIENNDSDNIFCPKCGFEFEVKK